MRARRSIEIVDENGVVHLDVGTSIGTRIEVIVLELTDSIPEEAIACAKLHADSGFVHKVLGNKNEDVWNDL